MMNNLTVFEQMRGSRVPDYYDGMYRDGYKPWEILEAAHKTIINRQEVVWAERAAAQESQIPMNVKFNVEVHKK